MRTALRTAVFDKMSLRHLGHTLEECLESSFDVNTLLKKVPMMQKVILNQTV